ncbi:MAG: bifunctional [glutamate--ammonia ligase]-adenylyl-L-tyrosine phosphorylase/[glutamate--ammonia-ligase] adenylyltransferase, partial [Gammaproteobacteria bacterium]|nr:bifunctional [glutamate--ammonia ligase]-adenylyl-L-tyrosine phosphorylase/[glutamate--ammonia-ligase] adenylyltransferase [Gammaproteobacteria bacterium]
MDNPVSSDLPQLLREQWERIAQRLGDKVDRVAAANEKLAGALPGVASCSDFFVGVLERHADELTARLVDDDPLDPASLAERLDLRACSGEPEAMTVLREVRQVEMARIAWRELTGSADVEQSLADLSLLADCAIRASVEFAVSALEPRYGSAVLTNGDPAPLLVLAMGKLGGFELNFSSDIDLVLLFPDGARMKQAGIEVEEYFRRLAQLAIRLLDERTQDGFVFRVDTRLRPFGSSGPLVVSMSALEAYLVRHGRDWERYAYIKARLITGQAFEAELFGEVLQPFVYRRYLDYGVFDALRQMKALISKEVARRDMADNVKLGPGGIREIEFIVQAEQIVRGGRDRRLQERSLLGVLPLLAETGQLDTAAVTELGFAYRFLRRLENVLQAIGDQQTHKLPTNELDQTRLAYALGAESWDDLAVRVSEQRRVVEAWFVETAAGDQGGVSAVDATVSWDTAWESSDFDDVLKEYGFEDSAAVTEMLAELRNSPSYGRMDEPSRQRLAAVVSRIPAMLAVAAAPVETLKRVLPVLQAVGRRSAYLALLNERPAALERLLAVARQSEFLVRQVVNHPMLLDELLDARIFEVPPSRAELAQMLEQAKRGASQDDVEARLDHLRHFQRAAVFRIAVADRIGNLPLMKVSDRLTDTAELVLDFALETARRDLVQRHGKPMCGSPGNRREAGFIIVAYGKLGGLELGYGSDLDVVFLHDSSGPEQETDGITSVDNARFFVRLGQRLIHYLTIQTGSGKLYEIDTRLRPSGASGLLVSSMDAFHRYQREQAWVWEHQALLRSRSVAGPQRVRDAFEAERREVLMHHVDRTKLKHEVERMRTRMRAELSSSGTGEFDLKQDPGGLADIEFLVDYWVLASAEDYPELLEYPDNIRQLEALERTGLVAADRCQRLIETYIRIRERLHELALADQRRVVPDTELAAEREWVTRVWQETFADQA